MQLWSWTATGLPSSTPAARLVRPHTHVQCGLMIALALALVVCGADALGSSGDWKPSQVHLSVDPFAGGGGADWAPVVAWRSDGGIAFVQYGLAPGSLTNNISAETYTTHPGMGRSANFPFATLRGLRPDTTYFFRVGSSRGSWSSVHNLTTPPVSGTKPVPPWSFLAYGDLGTAPSDHEDLLGQDVNCTTNTTIDADPPGCPDVTLRQLHRREWDGQRPGLRHELVLHVGDIVYADYGCNLSTNVLWWDTFGEETEFLASSKPYMICPGNHDLVARTGPAPDHTATGDPESLRYNGRYRMPPRTPVIASSLNSQPQPGPERYYYSFSHRNIRFISISTEHALTPGSAQYQWLETELAAADTPKARQHRPWVLLFGHKPPVCSHLEVCGEAYVPQELMAKYHVDMALWGHLHAYERTLPIVNGTLATTGASYHNPTGTVHVVIGMAGDGFCCGGWSDPPSWSAFREDSFGYARVHVENDHELRLEYVRNGDARDSVRDNFTITKTPTSTSSFRASWREATITRHGSQSTLPAPESYLGHRAPLGACPENRRP
eukprot:COSAG02_NODE_893_length_16140_cov_19.677621_1_plen_552_part_00